VHVLEEEVPSLASSAARCLTESMSVPSGKPFMYTISRATIVEVNLVAHFSIIVEVLCVRIVQETFFLAIGVGVELLVNTLSKITSPFTRSVLTDGYALNAIEMLMTW